MMCHLGGDIFINALLAGFADCFANLISVRVSTRFGLLPTYRACSLIALMLFAAVGWFELTGMLSYLAIFLAVYCLASSQLYTTATIIDQTPAATLKEMMIKTVTIGSTLTCTIAYGFLVHPQPIPLMG